MAPFLDPTNLILAQFSNSPWTACHVEKDVDLAHLLHDAVDVLAALIVPETACL
jgi:hypothetical protein